MLASARSPWLWVSLAGGLAVVGLAWLLSHDGLSCASLEARLDPPGDAPTVDDRVLALDEARTRSEAPRVAAMLDDALGLGHGAISEEREARGRAYLDAVAGTPGWGSHVQWRGERVLVLMSVC